MDPNATLYLGVAAPLVEVYRLWLAKGPECDDPQQRRKLWKAFPNEDLGAYGIETIGDSSDPDALAFRTSGKIPEERITGLVKKWSGQVPKELPNDSPSPVSSLDHRRYVDEVQRSLKGQPLRIVPRIGLTLQLLQKDLQALKPELVMLFCHGTPHGELLFEDGRGLASVVSGRRIFEVLSPRPRVLFLAACHSEAVLRRAKEKAEWSDAAIVCVDSEFPIEVTAVTEFQSMFFQRLLDGETAGSAFDQAQAYLRNSEAVGDLEFDVGAAAPSRKFMIKVTGRDACLDETAVPREPPGDLVAGPRITSPRMRRAMDRFVGRRREVAEALNLLLPLPVGLSRATGQNRRLLTLTKEGGIGKTSLAAQLSDWVCERDVFPAGVFEVSCEEFPGPMHLLAQLLELFGVASENQRGNLLHLLQQAVLQAVPQGGRALAVLDNLDHLTGNQASAETARATIEILETLLGATRDLQILATCRWPVGVSQHETVFPVGALSDEDSRDVFLSHIESPTLALEVRETWEKEDSPIRRLIRLSGRHPLSLRLLARQLERPGMDLKKLCEEAEKDLLEVLSDPYSAENDEDREKKVRRSFELSYRHLSEPAKKLFARLSYLPGGVWCGDLPERLIAWHVVIGEDWKQLIEKELDYLALVHFEPDPSGVGKGFYRMLPAVLGLSRDTRVDSEDDEWLSAWSNFWQQHLRTWDAMLSGRVPDGLNEIIGGDRAAFSRNLQNVAASLFTGTQLNWLAVFEFAWENRSSLSASLLLSVTRFLRLTGQLLTARDLAERSVIALRKTEYDGLLASSLGTLGIVQDDLGDGDRARRSYMEALEIYRRLVGQDPAFEPDTAATLNNLGNVQRDLGEPDAARQSYLEALRIRARLARQHPSTFEPDLAMTLNNLGTVQSDLGQQDAALQSYLEALRIRRCLAQQHPAAFEPDVATTLNNLGTVQGALGEHDAASASYSEALEIYRQLAQRHPAAFEAKVAGTLNNLGTVQSELGEHETARQSYMGALEIHRRLAQQHPAAFDLHVATTLNNLGNVLRDLGEFDSSRRACSEALEIYRRLFGKQPAAFEPEVAMAVNNLGNVQRDLGDYDAALKSYLEALEIRRRLASRHPAAFQPDVATSLNNLGAIQRDLGKLDAARQGYSEALEIYRQLAQRHPAAFEPYVAGTVNNLGNVQRDLGERDAARQSYLEALAIYWPLAQKTPNAYGQRLFVALRNYTSITSELPGDPWWKLWKDIESSSRHEADEEPRESRERLVRLIRANQ